MPWLYHPLNFEAEAPELVFSSILNLLPLSLLNNFLYQHPQLLTLTLNHLTLDISCHVGHTILVVNMSIYCPYVWWGI